MVISKPPARWTAPPLCRLRLAFAGLVAATVFVSGAFPARAKSVPIKVLVSAPVSDEAHATMSTELWRKFVRAYVGVGTVVFAGPGNPTRDDCNRAGADYLAVAPFDLRPRLPGMPNASGRVAARTQLVVTNCLTGTIAMNQTINFDSDPASNAADGDFESVPEITWAHDVPAMLAKYPLVFDRIGHVIFVAPPFARVDTKAGAIRPGDGLRDFARADRSRRAEPIVMTVTQVFDQYLEVMFSSSGGRPELGDLVEPLPKATPPAS